MKDAFENDYEATGECRPPKKGDYYYSTAFKEVIKAWDDWPDGESQRRIIVRRIPSVAN